MQEPTKRQKAQWDRAFYRCPGAWFGNEPAGGIGEGNITVNVHKITQAIGWIKRRFQIVDTFVSPHHDGVTFVIRWKP